MSVAAAHPPVRDPDLARRLADDGWALVDLLGPDEVAELRGAWAAIVDAVPPTFDPTGMATTVRHPESDLLAHEAIERVTAPALARVFDRHEAFLSAFITKRPGAGTLPPHLDWSLVDEQVERTYGCWIALEPIGDGNGVLAVVPGSHLLVDFARDPEHPGHEFAAELVASGAAVVEVPTRPGQAVLFDHRLVHLSAPNETDRPRVAAAIGIAPLERVASARALLLSHMGRSAEAQIDPDGAVLAGSPTEGHDPAPEALEALDAPEPAPQASTPAAPVEAGPASAAAPRAGVVERLRRLIRR